jgi:hypothetical protein
MLYFETKSGQRIPYYNTEQYREGLRTRLEKLKTKVKEEINQEDYEYMVERQAKLWLGHDEPTEDNPFPAFSEQNLKRVLTSINISSNPLNAKPKVTECD